MPAGIAAAHIRGPNILFGMSKHIPWAAASSAKSVKSLLPEKTYYAGTSRTMQTTRLQSVAVNRLHQVQAVFLRLADLARLPGSNAKKRSRASAVSPETSSVSRLRSAMGTQRISRTFRPKQLPRLRPQSRASHRPRLIHTNPPSPTLPAPSQLCTQTRHLDRRLPSFLTMTVNCQHLRVHRSRIIFITTKWRTATCIPPQSRWILRKC